MAKNVIEFALRAKDGATKKFKEAGGGLKGIKNILGGIPGVAAIGFSAVIGGLTAMAKKTATLGDDYAKFGKSVGATSEELSELAFAADRSGASFDDLKTGLRTAARTANEAKDGVATYKDAWDRVGVSVTDASGKLKPVEQLVMESADAFRDFEDDTEAAALAQDLFGRAGIKLLPLFKEGSKGIEDMRQRARDLGISFESDLAAKSEKFIDAQTDAKMVLKGLGIQIGTVLLPILTKLLNWFSDGIVGVRKWFRANKEGIQGVTDVTSDAVGFAIELWLKYADTILMAVEKVIGGLEWLADKVGVDMGNASGSVKGFRDSVALHGKTVTDWLDRLGEKSEGAAEEFSEDVDRMGTSLDGLSEKAETAEDRIKRLETQFGITRPPTPEIDDFEDSVVSADAALKELTIQQRAEIELFDEMDPKMRRVNDRVEELRKNDWNLSRATENLNDRFGEEIESLRTLADLLGLNTSRLQDYLNAINTASNVVDIVGDLVGKREGGGAGAGGGGSGVGGKIGTAASAVRTGRTLWKLGSKLFGKGASTSSTSFAAAAADTTAVGKTAAATSAGASGVLGALGAASLPMTLVALYDQLFGQKPEDAYWTQKTAREYEEQRAHAMRVHSAATGRSPSPDVTSIAGQVALQERANLFDRAFATRGGSSGGGDVHIHIGAMTGNRGDALRLGREIARINDELGTASLT